MTYTKDSLKIVFFGTPDFAVESLDRLVKGGYNIVGVVTMPDGTIYMFAVIINPGYNGAYHINYNGNPLFIGYNTTHDNSGSEGYKLISPDHYSTSAAGDEIFIIEPSGVWLKHNQPSHR